jgi:TrmH family RNA methyltransferase
LTRRVLPAGTYFVGLQDDAINVANRIGRKNLREYIFLFEVFFPKICKPKCYANISIKIHNTKRNNTLKWSARGNFILSLQKKKEREKEGLFVIEGDKIVKEFLTAKVRIRTLVAKPEFINSLSKELWEYIGETESASFDELRKISTLRTPHNALAVVAIPGYSMDSANLFQDLTVALDSVQDPGNLGTIVRAAAWFGIKDIVCSENCVDVFNPKVIQSTMGAILNVRVHYRNLEEYLGDATRQAVPVFGALLEGESIYAHSLGSRGIILLGNESKGISEDLIPFITWKIKIPKFTTAFYGIESLNVGMAASVIFSEFARRKGGS